MFKVYGVLGGDKEIRKFFILHSSFLILNSSFFILNLLLLIITKCYPLSTTHFNFLFLILNFHLISITSTPGCLVASKVNCEAGVPAFLKLEMM